MKKANILKEIQDVSALSEIETLRIEIELHTKKISGWVEVFNREN